jgi:glycosyltransferase involved in cell wall biosynthesis
MKSKDITLSIALVTRNRPESLELCLESVRAQSVQPSEIVVSDDSDDDQMALTRQVAEKFGCRHARGPRRGLYANRNHAAVQCHSSHIRTMDDDHRLPPDHLELCLRSIEEDPEAFWSTGEDGTVQGVFAGSSATALALGRGGVGYPPKNPDDTWAYADGSTIYPRSVVDRGLRMVEELGYGSWYLEYGAYLYAHGYRGRCVPGARVEHHAEARMSLGHDLAEQDLQSRLYASLVFSIYFRPSLMQSLGQLRFWLGEGGLRRLEKIWPKVVQRWGLLRARHREEERRKP